MKKIKILSIFGTRPEAIKMAPVIKMLADDPQFDSQVCLTGQHRSMLDQVINLFKIKVDYDLDIMQENQRLSDLLSRLIKQLDDIVKNKYFDWILVQGDTTTCLAGALIGFYNHIKVGHIEAGLRTGDLSAPFPEECNRALVGRIANRHFAPTQAAKNNLLQENITPDSIVVTGNTVIDALMWVADNVKWHQSWQLVFGKKLAQALQANENMVLITGHRRESFGQGFTNICEAIKTLAKHYPSWHFVYPVHLNPNVQAPVFSILEGMDNIHLIAPLDYEPFVYVMQQAKMILTDSGGIQEEAPALGKPVLVMRDKTERPEGVDAGVAKLVGIKAQSIVDVVTNLIEDNTCYQRIACAVNPYGDGKAAGRILESISRQ